MKIQILPDLFLSKNEPQSYSLVRVIPLLSLIQERGNLRAACTALKISYRTGWAELKEVEKMLGGPMVKMIKGRGSVLTELGKRLVWSEKLIHARLDPLLASMSKEIEAEIFGDFKDIGTPLKVLASHDFSIELLGAHMNDKNMPLEMNFRGNRDAISALNRGMCDIAGLHIPTCSLKTDMLNQYKNILQSSHALVNLSSRKQGIFVKEGNPKNVWRVEDLARPDVLFVNRQHGSGTRSALDLLLAQQGISGENVNGYECTELTHAAVSAYVACGKADVGIGVEMAAREFNLDFIPLINEHYYLVLKEKTLKDMRFKSTLDYMQSNEFKSAVSNMPGYDSTKTGVVMTREEAFPEFSFH